jgi:hypothetical protein
MTTPPSTSSLDIHRLLDEAFAGVRMTPDLQDLKEELRASLVARTGELEAEGVAPSAAARRAFAELGDVRGVIGEVTGDPAGATDGAAPWRGQRVRPRPGYVVRTVLVGVLGAGALAATVVGVLGRAGFVADAVPAGWSLVAAAVAALAGGLLVADALRQETTANYPVPRPRAAGYGAATLLALGGLGAFAHYPRGIGALVAGSTLMIVAAGVFGALAATQTNRHKPWVVRLRAEHEAAADRFARDPVAAARFGVYTAVIWTVALTAGVVVGFAAGWIWSPLPLVGGGAVMMLTLARMLFVPSPEGGASRTAGQQA